MFHTLPYALEPGLGHQARIGLVVLASDYTIEFEFDRFFRNPAWLTLPAAPGRWQNRIPHSDATPAATADATLAACELYTARIANSPRITPATLAAMRARLRDTVELILPGDTLDIVAYGCTSASVVIGEQEITSICRQVHPQAHCTTPITAAKLAFRNLGAQRIGVLTPYQQDVNEQIRDHLVAAGYDIPVIGSFNEPLDPRVARIGIESISSALQQLAAVASVDMWFVSCTSLRLVEHVGLLEHTLGVPVTSSNHAMIWHVMQLLGVDHQPCAAEYGTLFKHRANTIATGTS